MKKNVDRTKIMIMQRVVVKQSPMATWCHLLGDSQAVLFAACLCIDIGNILHQLGNFAISSVGKYFKVHCLGNLLLQSTNFAISSVGKYFKVHCLASKDYGHDKTLMR